MVGPSTGNCLGTDSSIFAERKGVGSQNEFGRCSSVLGQTEDGKVFMIKGLIVQKFFRCLGTHMKESALSHRCGTGRDKYLFHDRENPRLRIIIAVGANAQIDLLGIRVGFICRCELENARGIIG